MDHYVDIELLSDPEFPVHQLMAALYAKLHRALVAQNSPGIGVSFPELGQSGQLLGKRMRLHGDLGGLTTMLASNWLAGMRDHVVLTPPTRVPDSAMHRVVRRVQVKSSPERLRRRLMRRQGIDALEAQQRIPDEVACLTSLPFVQMRSTSTGQIYRLFIDHGQVQSKAVPGDFNAYGLSQVATVPWF